MLQRRAERGLGVAIRAGQAAGEIIKNGDIGGTGKAEPGTRSSDRDDLVRPSDFFTSSTERTGIYTMTDSVSDARFEEVLAEARVEGNVSRSNIVRKIKTGPTAD